MNSTITVFIRVSKNDTSISSCVEKMFNVYVLIVMRTIRSLDYGRKTKCERVSSKYFGARASLRRDIAAGNKGVSGNPFYPGLRKIYRLSGVRNLKSLLLSVPRELRVRRGGKYIARKSGSPQLFSSPILVINFQVVQQRPGTQERCYRRCSRTRRVVTQDTFTTLRTY